MFIGIDHGTSAMRFAGGGGHFRIARRDATSFTLGDLEKLGPCDQIEAIALTYSMGDNFSAVTPIDRLEDRGLVSREGAGEHTGGGTRVFDVIKESGIPAFAVPGLHRGSPTDPRFKAYSHQASPEKIGIAYRVAADLGGDLVISDISSNTVSILVRGGKIVGALDACLFAPGSRHGAIDVSAIRSIDRGEITANQAFLKAGVEYSMPEHLRIPTVAMFAAMECAALLLLAPTAKVALAGSLAKSASPVIGALLGRDVAVYDEWCAAEGLARIAEDVTAGARSILGIEVVK